MGTGKFDFDQINDAVKYSNLLITTFRPNHVNRNEKLYIEAINFSKRCIHRFDINYE